MMTACRQGAFILRNLITHTKLTCHSETRSIKRWVSPTLRELKRRKDKLGPEPEKPRSSFLDWNYNAEIYAFSKRLNESFDNDLLRKALTHRSYVIKEESRQQNVGIENPKINLEDNKSLIREGEEFITNYIKEYLHESLPKFPTDGVTSICNHVTSDDSLANIASHIGLKDIILCSEYPPENSTLSNTFKAVVAAILHSSGENRACAFVRDFVIAELNGKDLNELWEIKEPLEMLKGFTKFELEPRLCNQSAKNTILAAYQVGLYSPDKKLIGIGWGENIEIAIEMAARDGLKRIFETRESMPTLKFKKSPITSTHEQMYGTN